MMAAGNHTAPGEFEKLYLRLREKEGRIYSDEEVAQLPAIKEAHPHHKEWLARKESAQKLINYLKKKKKATEILEIGCGNGWLSAKLAGLKGSMVTGIDINRNELEQAKRVFSHISNIQFIHGGIEELKAGELEFDVIVIAAAVQYFPSLEKLFKPIMGCLGRSGEIHIIDSHFYPLAELSAAKERSLLYYEAAGFPEMANWYFHHSFDELEQFDYSILYDPDSLFNRFLRNKNPFYWVRINT
jgi:ubiquinone/menaquinone biosynthesis C-methylase UbiE